MGLKKKRVSKKKKISWRKHVDITDVEEFLEDQRLEERLGERIETLPDQKLFQVDTKPQEKPVSNRQKKKLAPKTLPKCFSLLQPLTNVPDPLIKRNRVRTKEERKHPIAKRNEEKRRFNGIIRAKEKQAAANREYERKRKIANKHKIGVFKNDLWEVEDINPVNVDDSQWLTTDTVRHNRQGLGKLRKTIPKSLHKKATIFEAVEAPHPGMSYNPSLKDHQALLQEVANSELDKIKVEKHIHRVTTNMFRKVKPEQKEISWLVEMSQGLPDKSKSDVGKENDNEEYRAINPPALNKKKDKKQRRKQKEQKQQEKLRMDSKTEQKKISDIYKLKKLNKFIESKEKKNEKLQKKRTEKRTVLKSQTKTISKVKFENPDLDFQMGQDISGNLRSLRTEGNLLRDRFKSLQKRNILEPTLKQPPRKKAKVKKFEKASHKMGWEPKGY